MPGNAGETQQEGQRVSAPFRVPLFILKLIIPNTNYLGHRCSLWGPCPRALWLSVAVDFQESAPASLGCQGPLQPACMRPKGRRINPLLPAALKQGLAGGGRQTLQRPHPSGLTGWRCVFDTLSRSCPGGLSPRCPQRCPAG